MRRLRVIINGAIIVLLVFAVAAMFIPLLIRFYADRYVYSDSTGIPETQVAVVLGASVVGGKPSPILEERAHAAVDLYRAGKVAAILVTGDNSSLSHDEVTPVRKYLIDAGIPAEDIFLDHAGFDTYSSMYRAKEIFGARSLTIVTQDFHLPRAVFIARMLGLNAYGLSAKGSGSGNDYVREVPASLKALSDLLLRRAPKYLGEKIPLTGDGSTTWY